VLKTEIRVDKVNSLILGIITYYYLEKKFLGGEQVKCL
jgi:hypothetical protein